MWAASGIWVPVVLSIALVGLGFMLGWIWGERHGRTPTWIDGYSDGYLDCLTDSRRSPVTPRLYAPDRQSSSLEEERMTAYRDRMVAGEHDAEKRGTKAAKSKAKAAESKRAGKSTTSKNVRGLSG